MAYVAESWPLAPSDTLIEAAHCITWVAGAVRDTRSSDEGRPMEGAHMVVPCWLEQPSTLGDRDL